MINLRYKNDGKPVKRLNRLQKKTKNQVEEKIYSGEYNLNKKSCALCNQMDFETLSYKDRFGFSSASVICRNCGFIQINPRMNQPDYNKFYLYEYRKLYMGIKNPDKIFFSRQYQHGEEIYTYLEKNNLIKKEKKLFVLEVGCGAGGILKYFKDKGCEICGIDPGKKFVEYGVKKFNLNLHTGTLQDLKLEKKPDLIIYSHVIEHIEDINLELESVQKKLKEDGLLYIEVPGVKNLKNNYYEYDFLKSLHIAHVYHFTLRTLKNLLNQHGFKLIYGNEKVSSVFKKEKENNDIESDYKEVLEYINQTEKERKSCFFTPYKIRGAKKFFKNLINLKTVKNYFKN
ncbi:MAG: class I SAM-dependent methyltransferase [Candidatus Muiribacteriota bacterium]